MVRADYFSRKAEIAALIVSGCILSIAALSALPDIEAFRIGDPVGLAEYRIEILRANLAECDVEPRPICPVYRRQLRVMLAERIALGPKIVVE